MDLTINLPAEKPTTGLWAHPGISLIAGFFLSVLMAVGDKLTGYDIAFTVFYIVPVAFTTYYCGRTVGIVNIFFSAAGWLASNYGSGQHPAIIAWNAMALILSLLVVNYLLSRFLKIIEDERILARLDFLTGTLNRRAFYEVAEKEMARTRRYHRPFTVAYLDLDNFKTINDTRGHTTGDALLRTLCTIIRANLRETDILARLGGDEFSILLPETGEAEAGLALAKIQGKVIESMQANQWPVSMSIGATVCDDSVCEINAMLNSADELMYRVKTEGKNGIRLQKFGALDGSCPSPYANNPAPDTASFLPSTLQ